MNIIGDIAGQFDTLMALLKKMPDDGPVSLGDMNDRGPKSKEVFDFFMNNGRAIFGNHEHLCVEFYRNNQGYGLGGYYEPNLWIDYNGGDVTHAQIKDEHEKYCEWLKTLPFYIEEDGYFLSHAVKNPSLSLDQVCSLGPNAIDPQCDRSIIWNRHKARRMKDKIQIHGHMAVSRVFEHRDKEGIFGYNIDTSRAKKLTGYSTLTKMFYEQEYI